MKISTNHQLLWFVRGKRESKNSLEFFSLHRVFTRGYYSSPKTASVNDSWLFNQRGVARFDSLKALPMYGLPYRCTMFSDAFGSAWHLRPHAEHGEWSKSRVPIEPHAEQRWLMC
jgi:hypothetical protein